MRSDVVIIGGGQAGLAISRCLTNQGIDHVVLERGRIGERWRTQSWASLRLLTPNWLNRLPGASYHGTDPDGFTAPSHHVAELERYAAAFEAPIETDTTVLSVQHHRDHWHIATERGSWVSRAVVVATGACGTPFVPSLAQHLDSRIRHFTTATYRSPESLPDGGVLVVGAAASGLQLAEEIRLAGRPVTLAVGSHTRLPRRYRGYDIFAWLDWLGILDERASDVDDLARLRGQPSLQLVGDPSRHSIDLAGVQRLGVELRGRLIGAEGSNVGFDDSLADTTADAQRRLDRLLRRIDKVAGDGLGRASAGRPPRFIVDAPASSLDLHRAGIRSVLWATGFRPAYPWLHAPVTDETGEIVHQDGIAAAPGLFVLGLRFLRRRSSSFIAGCGRDAVELTSHVAASLCAARCVAA